MNRFLQFGSGPHHLPAPWENFDIEVDICKVLCFDSDSARFILAEHVIEHVPFASGLGFLEECYRVLQPGGVLRLCFPDITRIHPQHVAAYGLHMAQFGKTVLTVEDVKLSILKDWGHRSCWTWQMAIQVLEAVGFRTGLREYGKSGHEALNGIDSHHLSCGRDVAVAESTIIEATK
jgi:predicted SAM-dependent methyltransferase